MNTAACQLYLLRTFSRPAAAELQSDRRTSDLWAVGPANTDDYSHRYQRYTLTTLKIEEKESKLLNLI